ncbi:tyrosine-type recombinase/integrase [Lichenihabitans psoromatis]|uniref:tyrosine-type recombinase/integrase n=1 Tax=Lichenihabitans psoromatis TaxID=2528642 RepID=UPI0010384CB5|nr:site-specific integrase [Lichenihabitans psoromatis]
MRLTQAAVDRYELPPGKSEVLLFDKNLPGFGLRVRAGGKKTWVAQYRLGTKQRRLTLGTAGADGTLDADEARKRAKVALAKVSLGTDPQTEKRAAQEQASVTLGAIVPRYLTYAARRQSVAYHADAKRYLTRHWAPLAEMALQQIERSTISARLSEIATENGLHAANRARATLSAFYAWALGDGVASSNPVIGTHKATEEIRRDRVLTDTELAEVWHQSGRGDFGAIVRLLILTGQRREEVGGMLWSELHGDVWRIGAERAKNGIAHDIPLSEGAASIISSRSRRERRELVFGAGEGPFQGWSNAKTNLDEGVLAGLKKAHGAKVKLPPWRLHDLRRTVATRMADLGVLPHVIEAVLNHVSGHKAGVAGIYNRSTYAAEKRAALDLWGAHVERLVSTASV